MNYTIYKTTNIISGKYYIGAHKAKNINDNYLGSGHIIKDNIKKYGRENFVKEILFVAKSEPIMYWIERMVVDEEIVNDTNSFNMKLGGVGGTAHKETTKQRMKKPKSETHKANMRIGIGNRIWVKKIDKHEFIKEENLNSYLKNGWVRGRLHNSIKGRKWVNNSEINKMVDANEYEYYLKDGWSKGQIKDNIWVYNSEKNIKIKEKDFKEYQLNGWKKGRMVKFR